MRGQKTGGRQAGSKNRRTLQLEPQLAAVTAKATAEAATLTPLDLMLSIMRNPDTGIAMRADMAKAAAPYCHARLQAKWGSTSHPPYPYTIALSAWSSSRSTSGSVRRITGS
jgi:hypothetical protein